MLSGIYRNAAVNVSGTGGTEQLLSAALFLIGLCADLDHYPAGSVAVEAIGVASTLLEQAGRGRVEASFGDAAVVLANQVRRGDEEPDMKRSRVGLGRNGFVIHQGEDEAIFADKQVEVARASLGHELKSEAGLEEAGQFGNVGCGEIKVVEPGHGCNLLRGLRASHGRAEEDFIRKTQATN